MKGGVIAEEKIKNSKDISKDIKKEDEMVVRRRIGGKCYEVRERNTSVGRKGTIIRKCPAKTPNPQRRLVSKKKIRKFFGG